MRAQCKALDMGDVPLFSLFEIAAGKRMETKIFGAINDIRSPLLVVALEIVLKKFFFCPKLCLSI